jgi:hypothetical protein
MVSGSRPFLEVSEEHEACEKHTPRARVPELESDRGRASVLCRMALYHLRNINPGIFNAYDYCALDEALDAVEDLVRCFPERTTTVTPEQAAR